MMSCNRLHPRELTATNSDAPFSRDALSDEALTAAIWTQARFGKEFPGWELYRRIIAGAAVFDRVLLGWAIGGARVLARAQTTSGRDYLRQDARGPWIAWAAADALYAAIHGKFPFRADQHGQVRGIRLQTYRKIRDPVLACMLRGLEHFRSELHYQYYLQVKAQIDERPDTLVVEGAYLSDVHAGATALLPGDGNLRVIAEPLHG